MSHSPRIDTLMSWLLELCKGRQKLRPSSYPSRYPFIWVTRRLCWHFFHRNIVTFIARIEPSFQRVYHPSISRLWAKKDIKIRWAMDRPKGTIRKLLAISKVDGFPRIFTDTEGRRTLCQLVRENCRRWKLWTTVASLFKNSAINKMCKQVALLWCRWWRV